MRWITSGNRLEKLSGDRKGQWSIRINDQCASEAFLEQRERIAAERPELYRELARLYCVSPLSW